jgi:two-component system, LytTR family, response regulator AlgR
VNVLIVDDEPPARSRLRQLLEEDGAHRVVGEAANGRQALQMAADLAPDVVLLDISMPGLNGIETARHLNTFEKPPSIIFTTAYDRYAVEAFDARAVGYVLKPVRRQRLERALEQAARLNRNLLAELGKSAGLDDRRHHLCARVRGELRLIPLAEIDYCIADQKYVRVHHRNGQDLIEDSLKMLEDEFPETFVRIHRSALVSVARIESLRKADDGRVEVRLRNDRPARPGGEPEEPLVISRRHLAEVKRRLRGN